MAITSSAKKAIRASVKKRVFNLRRKWSIEKVEKDIRKLITEGKKKEAMALVPSAYQAIDKAVKTNFVKKNTGSRMKSRLVKFLNKK
jgi:small subunit ribosomal protein S20